jgi:hypothetical protein
MARIVPDEKLEKTGTLIRVPVPLSYGEAEPRLTSVGKAVALRTTVVADES